MSKKEIIDPTWISKCHKTPVFVGGGGMTHYYVCTTCRKICDFIPNE